MSFRSTLSAVALVGAMAVPTTFALPTAPAFAEGDPEAGSRIYRQCQACHIIEAEQNRVGPHLVKIINRPIAEVEGFRYSPVYLERREEGKVWNEENLAGYLANPREYMPGNRMAFAGLRNPQQIDDVIAYLRETGGVWEE
ncbi:MAG: c-type cytochrome [Pseudomonadota bacterium]